MVFRHELNNHYHVFTDNGIFKEYINVMREFKINRLFTALLLNISLHTVVFAAENINTGRYSELTTTATTEQLWPLSNTISIQFVSQTTVQQAIKIILVKAGYELHPDVWGDPSLVRLLNLSIPPVHETFDQMAIQEIVHALVGSSLDILVDPVTRYISFEPTVQSLNP